MTQLNDESREMTFDELEQISGGDLLNRMIDQAMAALGASLLAAVHTPIVPPISLHMR
jgi:bacteriocin-like protein